MYKSLAFYLVAGDRQLLVSASCSLPPSTLRASWPLCTAGAPSISELRLFLCIRATLAIDGLGQDLPFLSLTRVCLPSLGVNVFLLAASVFLGTVSN